MKFLQDTFSTNFEGILQNETKSRVQVSAALLFMTREGVVAI